MTSATCWKSLKYRGVCMLSNVHTTTSRTLLRTAYLSVFNQFWDEKFMTCNHNQKFRILSNNLEARGNSEIYLHLVCIQVSRGLAFFDTIKTGIKRSCWEEVDFVVWAEHEQSRRWFRQWSDPSKSDRRDLLRWAIRFCEHFKINDLLYRDFCECSLKLFGIKQSTVFNFGECKVFSAF